MMLEDKEKRRRGSHKATLYAWGANSHGQLGLGFANEQIVEPTVVENLPDNLCEMAVTGIFGGGGHTLLLTNDGKLYGAGKNDSGQVGNGTQTKVVPNLESIRGLEDQEVISVACGWNHTVALTSQGQVWVWGSNSHSQLGLPVNEVPFSCLPICLNISGVVSVAAGLRHTVVATNQGHVYSWGQGLRGQLGHVDEEGKMINNQPTPKIVECLNIKVGKVACGQNTTYAITKYGYVMAWGDNKFGQLAHDPVNVAFFSYPLILPMNYFGGAAAVSIQAGWTHCAVQTLTDQWYMWGRADYGQLGPLTSEEEGGMEIEESSPSTKRTLDEKAISSPQTSHQKLKIRCRYIPSCLNKDISRSIFDIKCGSEHTLALSSDWSEGRKKLMAFGWNEHGSCGNGNTDNVFDPVFLDLQGDVLQFGAGAGHSFAVMIGS